MGSLRPLKGLPSTQWTASALVTMLISTLNSSAHVLPYRRCARSLTGAFGRLGEQHGASIGSPFATEDFHLLTLAS